MKKKFQLQIANQEEFNEEVGGSELTLREMYEALKAENERLKQQLSIKERQLQSYKINSKAVMKDLEQKYEFPSVVEGRKQVREWIEQNKDLIQAAASKPDRAEGFWDAYSDYDTVKDSLGNVNYVNVKVNFENLSKKWYAQAKQAFEAGKISNLSEYFDTIYKTNAFMNANDRFKTFIFSQMQKYDAMMYQRLLTKFGVSPESLTWDFETTGTNTGALSGYGIRIEYHVINPEDSSPEYVFTSMEA